MDPLLEKIYGLSAQDCEDCARHLMVGGGTRGGPLLVRGQGVRLRDADGKDYIDCTSQSWAAYLGFANETIRRVVSEQMERLSRAHQGFDTLPRFYGTTLGTMGASWVSTRASGELIGGSRFLGLTKPFVRVPNPYCYRCPLGLERQTCSLACAQVLRTTLERGIAGNAAGVILEPIQGSAGQIICPRDYLQAVRRICDEFSVPLIFDEIQTFARIGTFFAADFFGVTPDIMALGKGLGAGLPIAATIVSDRLEGFRPDGEDLHTFASTTVAQVAAAKQIELLEDGVLQNTVAMGEYLRSGLETMQRDFPEIGDIRQAGLHIGIELVRDPDAKEPLAAEGKAVRAEGIKLGVIFGLGGVRPNVLKIKPALVINHAECDEVLEKLRLAMTRVLRK